MKGAVKINEEGTIPVAKKNSSVIIPQHLTFKKINNKIQEVLQKKIDKRVEKTEKMKEYLKAFYSFGVNKFVNHLSDVSVKDLLIEP